MAHVHEQGLLIIGLYPISTFWFKNSAATLLIQFDPAASSSIFAEPIIEECTDFIWLISTVSVGDFSIGIDEPVLWKNGRKGGRWKCIPLKPLIMNHTAGIKQQRKIDAELVTKTLYDVGFILGCNSPYLKSFIFVFAPQMFVNVRDLGRTYRSPGCKIHQ